MEHAPPAEYVLYGGPGRASIAPQIVLEELGIAYRYAIVDLDAGEHRTPAFLRLNPGGRVPVLVEGELAVAEAAAICLHLADRRPEAGLLAPPGTPDRARAYQLLLLLATTVQPTMMEYFYPERYAAGAGGEELVRRRALDKLAAQWQQIDAELRGRATAVPGGFGVCDAYLYMLASWHRDEQRPLDGHEHLWRVLTAAAARPSIRRVAPLHRAASAAWWRAAVAMDPALEREASPAGEPAGAG
jgi:glutathione S-transferase